MFRGGDYIDEAKFQNPSQIKNTLDVSDITGAQAKAVYFSKATRDNMSVADINGKPPLYSGASYNVNGNGPQGYGQPDQRQQYQNYQPDSNIYNAPS